MSSTWLDEVYQDSGIWHLALWYSFKIWHEVSIILCNRPEDVYCHAGRLLTPGCLRGKIVIAQPEFSEICKSPFYLNLTRSGKTERISWWLGTSKTSTARYREKTFSRTISDIWCRQVKFKSCFVRAVSIRTDSVHIDSVDAGCVETHWTYYDRKARAGSAQSFTLWQQATVDVTRRDHYVIDCSSHMHSGAIHRKHPVRGESHIQSPADREVATHL